MMTLVIALAMVLAMSSVAFATDAQTPGTGTITITTPDTTNANETVTYTIYRVFDAEVNATTGAVVYKLLNGATAAPAGFTADSNGYITGAPNSLEDSTTAFANYSFKESAGTVSATGPSAEAVSGNLTPGYYYITTSTGAAVMVEAGGNTTVSDKNVLSTLKKSAGTAYSADAKKAIAAVNSNQSFTIVVTKKHGATKLDVSDTMTGMTFNGSVTVDGVDSDKYTLTGTEGDSSFSISFDSDYVKGLADNTDITIHYTCKITSDALQTDPGKNTAELTTDNNHKVKDEVEVYNAKIIVNKVDEEGEALSGAGFTLTGPNDYSVEITTGTVFEWKGLAAGEYTLEETTVPAGYTKADNVTFIISDSNYTAENLVKSSDVENKKGAVLPSTGGIGTTIFYILGSVLVIGSGILLISRKRLQK